MDQGRGCGDRVYRARVTLGERLLRKLQRPFQGRTLNWIFYSLKEGQMVIEQSTLHYEPYAFSPRMQTARTRKHHPHGGKANDALTI